MIQVAGGGGQATLLRTDKTVFVMGGINLLSLVVSVSPSSLRNLDYVAAILESTFIKINRKVTFEGSLSTPLLVRSCEVLRT